MKILKGWWTDGVNDGRVNSCDIGGDENSGYDKGGDDDAVVVVRLIMMIVLLMVRMIMVVWMVVRWNDWH